MINGTAAVRRGTMLTDMLDAPVAKLTMGHNVDVGENLLNAGSLHSVVSNPSM